MQWGWEEHPVFDDLPETLRGAFVPAAEQPARDTNKYNVVLSTELADERLDNPRLFCSCEQCETVTLTKSREAFCCHEVLFLNPEQQNTGCVTDDDDFENVCLNVQTLNISAQNRAFDNGIANFPDRLCKGPHNKELRHQAYRNFVLAYYGRRRLHERLEIPCCVVHRIRLNFPDEEGNYVPFEEFQE